MITAQSRALVTQGCQEDGNVFLPYIYILGAMKPRTWRSLMVTKAKTHRAIQIVNRFYLNTQKVGIKIHVQCLFKETHKGVSSLLHLWNALCPGTLCALNWLSTSL